MHRKLTITVSDDVYRGLYESVGRGNISHYIEDLLRPHVVRDHDLVALYREMAADEEREREAMEWIEAAVDEGLE